MAEIRRAIGREVRFRQVERAEFAAGLVEAGLPAADAEGLAHLFAYILDGHNSSLADGVQRALGRRAARLHRLRPAHRGDGSLGCLSTCC